MRPTTNPSADPLHREDHRRPLRGRRSSAKAAWAPSTRCGHRWVGASRSRCCGANRRRRAHRALHPGSEGGRGHRSPEHRRRERLRRDRLGELPRRAAPVPYFVMEFLTGDLAREAAARGRRCSRARAGRHPAAGRFGARGGARGRRHPPRSQAGQRVPHADGRDRSSSSCSTSASRRSAGAGRLTRAGHGVRHAALHEPRAGRGAEVDHRADIYALGIIMYEMFAGRVPFEADTYMGVLTKHMFAAPEPHRGVGARSRLPRRARARSSCAAWRSSPEDRYATMVEVARGRSERRWTTRRRRIRCGAPSADRLRARGITSSLAARPTPVERSLLSTSRVTPAIPMARALWACGGLARAVRLGRRRLVGQLEPRTGLARAPRRQRLDGAWAVTAPSRTASRLRAPAAAPRPTPPVAPSTLPRSAAEPAAPATSDADGRPSAAKQAAACGRTPHQRRRRGRTPGAQLARRAILPDRWQRLDTLRPASPSFAGAPSRRPGSRLPQGGETTTPPGRRRPAQRAGARSQPQEGGLQRHHGQRRRRRAREDRALDAGPDPDRHAAARHRRLRARAHA